MDSAVIHFDRERPLYLQIYEHFRTEITSGRLREGERVPAIRQLAQELSVSKITVERAYDQLCGEGYITSANRARYRVASLEEMPAFPVREGHRAAPPEAAPPIRYDFASGEMDPEGFDFRIWRRYLSRTLQDAPRLMRYGQPQGEPELRAELARYVRSARGVPADASQILVGPSAQSLLGMLCALLGEEYGSIAFEEPGFRHGRQIFEDHRFHILPIPMQKNGISPKALLESGARLAYISPSHQFPTGFVMPAGMRSRLLAWARQADALIVEDDYDSEFRYYGSPIPALKGMDGDDRVIYLGSFSKILPPSIRIGFMVLPEKLLERFRKRGSLYNQAASTAEQLALAAFMADGELERQVRRLRGRYQEKRRVFLEAIHASFGEGAVTQDGGTGLFVPVQVPGALPVAEMKQRARRAGCRIAALQDYALTPLPGQQGKLLLLYFSSIPRGELAAAVKALHTAFEGSPG